MREIKFRGYNGETWLFGNLDIDYKTKHACISDNRFWRHPVRFDTVGQFTGLCDSNGKEIFEGDIVKTYDGSISVVIWDDATHGWREMANEMKCRFAPGKKARAYIVIGNVHDNPDLLEVDDARD